ncbi:cytochrome b/b6 domain-containing protein [Geothrix terrae]|uniref:cytochrome b/b6 domain-containing protein n=1 Tax=Geothrix terrae TaxID=2922720 RepID=UPI001FADAB5B|nr:cytochrome b/b6 domain-containing protein [Geothrix terrae]
MTENGSTSTESKDDPASHVTIRVWDLPTRLLHWALAGLFAAAMVLAGLTSEHSPAFRWHMLAGLMMVAVVALRVVWGLFGSKHARFGSFLCGPGALWRYLGDSLKGRDARQAGHNPGAAYGAIAMLVLSLAIVATGLMMQGRKDAFEDLHEALAYGMAAAVAAHLLGLGFHAFRHRDRTIGSMVTGLKRGMGKEGISSFHRIPALVVLLLLGGWGAVLVTSFDAHTGSLVVPGTQVRLQLAEGAERGGAPLSEDDDD